MQKLGWCWYKNLSDEEKKIEYWRNRYRYVSTEDKQKLKDYAKNDAKYILILKNEIFIWLICAGLTRQICKEIRIRRQWGLYGSCVM